MANLKSLEKRIEENIKKAWYENGLCLMTIRDEELYKKKYDTFEDYIDKRWGFSRQHGYRLIDSANLVAKLTQKAADSNIKNVTENGKSGDKIPLDSADNLPKSEWQIRPLMTLKNDAEKIHVWNMAVESGEKITADVVTKKVNEFVESGLVVVDDNQELDYKLSSTVHVSKNSGENEWYTPQIFIDAARLVMGSIDLDPASSALANETVKAELFYTEIDNGLTQKWSGNVWMNPPYAQPLMSQFAEKLISELPSIKNAIVLINNATETKWFQLLASNSSAICFPTSRIKFIDKNGNPSGAPLQGQAFIYFGDNKEAFYSNFKQFGLVVYHVI